MFVAIWFVIWVYTRSLGLGVRAVKPKRGRASAHPEKGRKMQKIFRFFFSIFRKESKEKTSRRLERDYAALVGYLTRRQIADAYIAARVKTDATHRHRDSKRWNEDAWRHAQEQFFHHDLTLRH